MSDVPSANNTGPRVLSLTADQTGSARLRAAFGPAFADAATQPELITASRSDGVALVIVTPCDHAGRSLVTAVAAIRASRRSPPLYVYVDRSEDCVRSLMPMARAGARGVILANVDDDPVTLRKLLDRGTLPDVLHTITLAVQSVVATRHLPLLLHCLEHLAAPVPAAALARRLRVSRRTLSAWASKAGTRGVRSLTSKCRVLAAIEMMRRTDRGVEQIAHELHFGSLAHLHNTIRRYTGLRPRQAAEHDVEFWAGRFFSGTRREMAAPGPERVRLPPAEMILPRAEWPVPPNDPILPPTFQARA